VGSKILGARLGEGGWGAYLSGTHLGVPPWGDGVLLACSLLKAALVMFLKKKSQQSFRLSKKKNGAVS
jgi:hypothetical protein